MGTLTLAQFQAEMTAGLGNRDDVDSTRLTRALNLAQTQLARLHDFFEMRRSSTSFTFPYTGVLATDRFIAFSTLSQTNPRKITRMLVIDGGTSWPLEGKSERQFDSLIPNPEFGRTGRPEIYTLGVNHLGARRIELWPIPNQAYNGFIRWTNWPTALSGSSDVSDFLEKDDVLIWLALSYLFHSLGEYERANKLFGMAKGQLTIAIDEDTDNPDTTLRPNWELINPNASQSYWLSPFVMGPEN